MNIIQTVGELPIKQNVKFMDNWGILFGSKAAYVAGPSFAVKISNVKFDYNHTMPFYNVDMRMFTQNTMLIDENIIEEKIKSVIPYVNGSFRMPVGNIYNFLTRELSDPQNMRKSRMIIKYNPGIINDGCVLFKAELIDNQIVFTHPIINKPLRVSLISKVKEYTPGSLYQCELMNEASDHIEINVKYKHFQGFEIMIHESETKYMPDSIAEVEDPNLYPERRVLRIPILMDNSFVEFEPIHLCCNLFFDILNLYKDFEWITLNLGLRINPIIISNERNSNDDPFVESVIVPLDPEVRGDIR